MKTINTEINEWQVLDNKDNQIAHCLIPKNQKFWMEATWISGEQDVQWKTLIATPIQTITFFLLELHKFPRNNGFKERQSLLCGTYNNNNVLNGSYTNFWGRKVFSKNIVLNVMSIDQNFFENLKIRIFKWSNPDFRGAILSEKDHIDCDSYANQII